MSPEGRVHVAHVMSRDLQSVDRLATTRDAMALMTEHGVTSLAVNWRDEDDEFGLLELRDIAARVIANDRAAERVNVHEIMSKPALTVAADMLVDNVVNLLVRCELTRAIVVDRDRNPSEWSPCATCCCGDPPDDVGTVTGIVAAGGPGQRSRGLNTHQVT